MYCVFQLWGVSENIQSERESHNAHAQTYRRATIRMPCMRKTFQSKGQSQSTFTKARKRCPIKV